MKQRYKVVKFAPLDKNESIKNQGLAYKMMISCIFLIIVYLFFSHIETKYDSEKDNYSISEIESYHLMRLICWVLFGGLFIYLYWCSLQQIKIDNSIYLVQQKEPPKSMIVYPKEK